VVTDWYQLEIGQQAIIRAALRAFAPFTWATGGTFTYRLGPVFNIFRSSFYDHRSRAPCFYEKYGCSAYRFCIFCYNFCSNCRAS
jgi:hypothetical protein